MYGKIYTLSLLVALILVTVFSPNVNALIVDATCKDVEAIFARDRTTIDIGDLDRTFSVAAMAADSTAEDPG